MAKKCCYCPHSYEDDQGTWCGVDWDSLEYYPEREARVNADCKAAGEKADRIAMAKAGEQAAWKDDPNRRGEWY